MLGRGPSGFLLLVGALASAACSESTAASDSSTGGGGAGGGAPDGSAEKYVICDGNAGLHFGYQLSGGGTMLIGQHLLAQNGWSYLLVDGICHYWVFGGSQVGELGYWQTVRTGVLGQDQAEALSTDLQLADWPDHVDAGPGCPDGSSSTLWTTDDVVGGMPCSGGLILDLSKAARTWIDKLWSAGSDVDGPLRVRAISVPPALDDPSLPTASIGFDLGPYAVPWETGVSLDWNAPAALVSEPARTSELRSLRPKVAAGEYAGAQGRVLPVRQNGVLFWVFFRDTVPLENAAGLVRPP